MDKKTEALKTYIAAGFGNSTDFELQRKAHALAVEALAEQPAQQQQEPVVRWVCNGCGHEYMEAPSSCDCMECTEYDRIEYYTSPQPSKPLTDESIKIMREMLEVQGQPGNWNYDSYMHGLYNGMEYMVALVEKREPQFRDAPETWLAKYEGKRNNFNNTEAIEAAHGITGEPK